MHAWVDRVVAGTAQVADSYYKGNRISTVFYPFDEDGVNYETRVFVGGHGLVKRTDWRTYTYKTQREALVGHYWTVMQCIHNNFAPPWSRHEWQMTDALMHGVLLGGEAK